MTLIMLHHARLLSALLALCLFTDAPSLAQCGSPDAAPDCCKPALALGCQDDRCCEAVCAIFPGCCSLGAWSAGCAYLATQICDICPPPCGEGKGDCYIANGSAGCEDPSCCEIVCAMNPGCCVNNWTQTCANLAMQHCSQATCAGSCGGQAPGGCFCDDACFSSADCCDDICEHCPELAGCAPPPPVPGTCTINSGLCCTANGTPGCLNWICCGIVCAADPSCCGQGGGVWDECCASLANQLCVGQISEPPPFEGSCAGFCSDGGWLCWCDEGCCSFGDCCPDKHQYCGGCVPQWFGVCAPNPVDLNGDGVVDVFDLLDLLAQWGECEPSCREWCPADFDDSGAVDVFDLLELLANWTSP
jgi:hypothetical protein